MADFEVKTYPIVIEAHPNADRLELARVGDYRSVVAKGQFQSGDICAYIPEASIVPDQLIAEMGLEGKLAGPNHNRVRAVKLRGILSQGLIYPTPHHPAGVDVATELDIVKYEPPIPVHMSGEVENRFGQTVKFPLGSVGISMQPDECSSELQKSQVSAGQFVKPEKYPIVYQVETDEFSI